MNVLKLDIDEFMELCVKVLMASVSLLILSCIIVLILALFVNTFKDPEMIKLDGHVYKKSSNDIVCLDCCLKEVIK